MRFVLMTTAVMALAGCNKGNSKSVATVNEATGETIRRMTILLKDEAGSLDGLQFEGVVLKAQGLDASGAAVAFTDGKTESDVTAKSIAYRITRSDNYYKDLYRSVLMTFDIPINATQFKVDFSQIPNRLCTPANATANVSDVPDASADESIGNQFAMTTSCVRSYTYSGTINGLEGDIEIATGDEQKLTLSGSGAAVPFEIAAVPTLEAGKRDLTADEIAAFKSAINTAADLNPTGEYWEDTAAVTVLSKPDNQSCTVTNGSKTLESVQHMISPDKPATSSGYDVGGSIYVRNYKKPTMNDVTITCENEYTLSASVTGITSGTLTLRNQINLNSLALTADGTQSFTQKIRANDGYSFDVRIHGNTTGRTCTLTNDVGVASAAVVVTVTCVP